MPVALTLPLTGHTTHTLRLRNQIKASQPLKKRLWQSIIKCKIQRQGDVLKASQSHDYGLYAMANRVRSGDPDNLEAQAAQRYWPKLMGKSFRRDRFGAFPNAILNFGYAVTRSAVARALCSSGLHPALGIFHHNRNNNFSLADDLIEVWRPFVDFRVWKIINENTTEELNKNHKQAILSLMNETVTLPDGDLPMHLAIGRMASSLASSFDGHKNMLHLPQQLK